MLLKGATSYCAVLSNNFSKRSDEVLTENRTHVRVRKARMLLSTLIGFG